MRQLFAHRPQRGVRVGQLTAWIDQSRNSTHDASIRVGVVAPPYTRAMHTTSIRALLATFTLFALSACGVSDNLPAVAVSAKTASVTRISTTGLSSLAFAKSAEAIAAIMSNSKVPQIAQASGLLQMQAAGLDPKVNPKMQKLDETMESLREINAKAIYVIVDGDAVDELIPTISDLPIDQPGIILLVQTASTGSQGDVFAVASNAFGGAVVVENLGKGWYWVKGDGDQTLPAVPDPDGAKAFESALNALPAATVTTALRVTQELRDACIDALENDDSGMGMFFGGFMKPLTKLSLVSGSCEFGSNPTLRASLTFEDKESAGVFNTAWSTTTRSLAGMAGMMLGSAPQGEPTLDPKTFTNMAAALDMKQDETRLTLTLDDAAWKKLIP